MRFGIMDMQMGALVPAELAPERALEHLASFSQARIVRELAGYRFKLIELGGDLPLFFPQAFGRADVEELATAKRELGLSYTVHLPLWSVEPSTPQKPVREGSVAALVDMVRATLPLEPEVYVLHEAGALAAEFYHMQLPAMARALVLKQFQNNARESIQTILAETGLASRRIAIETIEFPFELMLELAEALDLSITFDTGHVLAGFPGTLDLFEALERVLPRLGEIHLHDSPRGSYEQPAYGKDHQPLGAGALDLARLLDVLTRARYDGPIIFELTIKEALASLAAIRALRPYAFR
jgi:sugar phosphate isomerase/epimerase